jgi:hypothetical protein
MATPIRAENGDILRGLALIGYCDIWGVGDEDIKSAPTSFGVDERQVVVVTTGRTRFRVRRPLPILKYKLYVMETASRVCEAAHQSVNASRLDRLQFAPMCTVCRLNTV